MVDSLRSGRKTLLLRVSFGTRRQEGHLVPRIICQHGSRGQLGERTAAHACHVTANRLSIILNKDVATTDQLVWSANLLLTKEIIDRQFSLLIKKNTAGQMFTEADDKSEGCFVPVACHLQCRGAWWIRGTWPHCYGTCNRPIRCLFGHVSRPGLPENLRKYKRTGIENPCYVYVPHTCHQISGLGFLLG